MVKIQTQFRVISVDGVATAQCRACNQKVQAVIIKDGALLSCRSCNVNEKWNLRRYRRAVDRVSKKTPEVSHIEKPLPNVAVKTLDKERPPDDNQGEYVTIDGMTVPRSGYGGHGSFSPSNPHSKDKDDNEASALGGGVSDPIVKRWSRKYRYSDSADV